MARSRSSSWTSRLKALRKALKKIGKVAKATKKVVKHASKKAKLRAALKKAEAGKLGAARRKRVDRAEARLKKHEESEKSLPEGYKMVFGRVRKVAR